MENIKIAKQYNKINNPKDVTDNVKPNGKVQFKKVYDIEHHFGRITYLGKVYKLMDDSWIYKFGDLSLPLTKYQVRNIFKIND